MAEDPPVPPLESDGPHAPHPVRRRRRLMRILVPLLCILVPAGTVMLYRQLVAQEQSGSIVLDHIRSGAVVELQLGSADAVVRAGAPAQVRTDQVRYPGGRLSGADRATLSALITARNERPGAT